MRYQEISLRKLKLSDTMQIAKLANNRNVWNSLRDYIPFPYSKSDAESFIHLTLVQDPQQSFGIEYKNELCGIISVILQKDAYKKSAEIGYWIGEPFWRKGIATKAVRLITDYGLQKLNLIRMYAGVFENNTASMLVLEKNGYRKESISKKAIIKNDTILDEHRYFIRNKNYN